jgi:chemotaxis protein methyltransferase CheR
MPLNQAEFEYVRALVQQRSAIALDQDKGYLAATRLKPLALREGFATVGGLLRHLMRSESSRGPDELHQEVVEAMATHETSFFRDVHPFEGLRRLLPQLAERRPEQRLRIWSAACSSGQEPCSIAMLLREARATFACWDVRVLATDLSASILDKARSGRYTQPEVNRGLPTAYLLRYFERQGLHWQVREEVRSLIEFQRLNLIEPWPTLPSFDVIFLRNVLIYFDVPVRKRLLESVRRVLRPDGYLFLGGSETTLRLDDAFEGMPLERAGCFRLRTR